MRFNYINAVYAKKAKVTPRECEQHSRKAKKVEAVCYNPKMGNTH